MAIINKDKYLKDIAARIQRGAMYFEAEDRPGLDMGGRKVFVSSVSFDQDRGELAYTVSNSKGEVLPSIHGVRNLRELDIKTLSTVSGVVRRYQDLQLRREQNLTNIESKMNVLRRRTGLGF